MSGRARWLWLLLTCVPALAAAEAPVERMGAAGYFRLMARPDLDGGNARLGWSNLYGRLLNEGPWGALEMRLSLLQDQPGRAEPWAAVHLRLEGGSFRGMDGGGGQLSQFAASQLYLRAGNLLLKNVTWRLGSLYTYPADLGLYDWRPAELFFDTVGLSATWDDGPWSVMLGLGDAGFHIRGADYTTIVSGGGFAKWHVPHFEVGIGGQARYEPEVKGSRFAPYATPGLTWERYVRRDFATQFLLERPGQVVNLPQPVPTASSSYKAVAYVGFGGLGPLQWNSLFATFQRWHPLHALNTNNNGQPYTLYLHTLTSQRTSWLLGNEMRLRLWPERLDAAWAVVYGGNDNPTNTVQPGEDNYRYVSTVLRLQTYLAPTLHLLTEGSAAHERALVGNLFRYHVDSMFQNTGGTADKAGLWFGDSPTRETVQLKAGLVLNPTGTGIFARPSLRLLYGLQYSTQQAAFGTGFSDSLDQYNVFAGKESHWHGLFSIEAESWF